MTRAVITGGTGYVGRFIAEEFLAEGVDVTVTGRTPPVAGYFSDDVKFIRAPLGVQTDFKPALEKADWLVHAAFDHVPGRYRGGEGTDPEGFAMKNLGGTAALFKQAKAAGVKRAVFLSSRAAYGQKEPGEDLYESDAVNPDTLYGKLKYEAEQLLDKMSDDKFCGVSLRVTGVYGPAGRGRTHKWESLFEDFVAGKVIAPRAATEVHGEDVARAAHLALTHPRDRLAGSLFNVSDIIVDRRDILAPLKEAAGLARPLPKAGDRSILNAMNTDRLKRLDWRAGGHVKLSLTLEKLVHGWLARQSTLH